MVPVLVRLGKTSDNICHLLVLPISDLMWFWKGKPFFQSPISSSQASRSQQRLVKPQASKNLWNGTLVKKNKVSWGNIQLDRRFDEMVCLELFRTCQSVDLMSAEGASTSLQIFHRHASSHLGSLLLIQILVLQLVWLDECLTYVSHSSLKLGGWTTWLQLFFPEWLVRRRALWKKKLSFSNPFSNAGNSQSQAFKPHGKAIWAQCLCTSCPKTNPLRFGLRRANLLNPWIHPAENIKI